MLPNGMTQHRRPTATILVLTATLAAVSLMAAPGQPPPSTPTFRSGVNLVTVDVVVRDKRTGRLISNLTRDDFTVQDEHAPQTISSFAAVDLPDARAARTTTGEPARQYAGNDLADAEVPDGRLIAFFTQSIGLRERPTCCLFTPRRASRSPCWPDCSTISTPSASAGK
jgi:hypothetical protein